ncbi:hypothetical protein ACH4Q7_05285 [Streptomyces roseolus]|uniref:hypothetical protein n=1 Tax=Streptomyces roseolus TaxID=67358 RepID=UPI0037ACAD6D
MRPEGGDIVYAFRTTKPPSLRRFSFRFGVQCPVLRLSPLSFTDEQGDDWIEVLPLPRGLMDTPLDPEAVKLIPVVDVQAYKETVPGEVLDVVLNVLEDGEPPWPTLREALGRRGGPTPPK